MKNNMWSQLERLSPSLYCWNAGKLGRFYHVRLSLSVIVSSRSTCVRRISLDRTMESIMNLPMDMDNEDGDDDNEDVDSDMVELTHEDNEATKDELSVNKMA